MYHAHFGLQRSLFESGIAQETEVFLGPRQQLVAANFKIALTTFDSVVVMTGPAGVGKTTLTSAALRTTTTRLALGWLNGAPANAAELLEQLLAEFGFNAHRVGRVERQQMWRQFLSEMSATESRVFVIAERAEDIAVDVLRALETLTAADPNGCPGANVVLLGQATLNEHLKSPALESLRQRIRLRQKLEPFSPEELRAYLEQRVTAAGGDVERIFAPDAFTALCQYTGGVARVVNNLCETALTLAATRQEQQLTAALITRIAVGLFGMEPLAAPNTVAAPPDVDRAPSAPRAAASVAAATPTPSAAPEPKRKPVADEAPTAPRAAATRALSKPIATAAVGTEPKGRGEPAAGPTVVDDELFTATDVPEVAMADFPILTDAVDSLDGEAAPAAEPVTRATTAKSPSRASTVPAARAAPATSPGPAGAAASRPPPGKTDASAAFPATAQPAPVAPPAAAPASKPIAATAAATPAPEMTDDELVHQTQTLRALATAKSIDDISNSMAETLFGDADLDMLSAALASAGWSDDDDIGGSTAPTRGASTEPPVRSAAGNDQAKQHTALTDSFLLDLGLDQPLELAEDPPSGEEQRKVATTR